MIKVLRTDGFTDPYTQEHNGKIEGRNMPNQFWGEVVSKIAYILNQSPTKAE